MLQIILYIAKSLITFLFISFLTLSCGRKTEKKYHDTGELQATRTFESDNVFIDKSYFKDGKLQFEQKVNIQNGDTLIEWFTMYNVHGKLYSMANDTIEIMYETDSLIRGICPRKNFKKNGMFKGYFSGKLGFEVNFVNDKKQGPLVSYDTETGKKKSEQQYENDIKTGSIKYFREDGSLERILYSKNGWYGKAEYFDENEVLEKTTTNKDTLFLSEGAPYSF